jgi:hypothetical protein
MRLLLEGPDLQTLLEQIRTEYGTGARIVQAEKIRRGGVGGFFARERFHIQVEVSDLATPALVPGRVGNPVKSVMDLVDRLNLEEVAQQRDVLESRLVMAPAPQTTPMGLATDFPITLSTPIAVPSVGAVKSDIIRPASVSSPTVSTHSDAFTEIMARLKNSIDSPAMPRTATPQMPEVDRLAAEPSPTVTAQPVAGAGSSPRPASQISSGAQMAARATRMGVPSHVLANLEDPADVYRRLLDWVEARPAAPMIASNSGQVIAVVGEIEASMRVASSLARELGMDPANIYLAVPASSIGHNVPVGRLLSDVSDIAMRRQRWQESVGSTIVVIEETLPPSAANWLHAVVSALAPTFTWAVAQASTKVNDVVSWAATVGDVDALALVNLPATGDPAAALAGPLAVGLLDGQRATVTRWMAMLTDAGSSHE